MVSRSNEGESASLRPVSTEGLVCLCKVKEAVPSLLLDSDTKVDSPLPAAETDLRDRYKKLLDDLGAGGGHVELDSQDQELILHWCTSTCDPISCNQQQQKSVQQVWQVAGFRTALHHSSLMHGLLTLSALHIASSCEMDREGYLEMAQRHRKEIAVPVSECPDLEHSPDATFALSAIVMMFSFGFSRVAEPMVSSLDSFVQIFQSVRDSIGAPLDTVDGTQEGRLGPFTSLESSTPCMPDTSQLAIHSLQTLNATLGDRDARHREVYDTTIQHLSFSFQKFFSGSDVAIAAFLWISRVPSQFMALLHERQPLALVILAHFAVIIHPLRRQWWMREWSTSIVREIGQVLGGEWRPSIRWVMDATGCYIPPCNES